MSGTPQPLRRRTPTWLLGSGVIAVAMGVMNVTTYGFTLVAARLLGPREYGQVAAAMGILLILNVLSLGLQATGARRISSAPHSSAATRLELLHAAHRAAAVIGLATAALSPVLAALFRLDLTVALLVAFAAVPLTVMGGQAGVLQGERRWLPLAGIYTAVGVGRLGVGVPAMAFSADATTAMAAVAVGSVAPIVVGGLAVRRLVHSGDQADEPEQGVRATADHVRGVLAEVAHNSHALLAFFVLSNTDILVARAVLDDEQSGLYAGGLILAKAVLFLPQFVVVLIFPSMSADAVSRERRRGVQTRALGLIAAMGLAATAAAAVLAPLAVVFVGGAEYRPLEDRLWAFAVLGMLLAMIQLLVYGVMARQQSFGVYLLWLGFAALLVAATAVTSLTGLLVAVLLTLTGVFGVLAGIGLAGARKR